MIIRRNQKFHPASLMQVFCHTKTEKVKKTVEIISIMTGESEKLIYLNAMILSMRILAVWTPTIDITFLYSIYNNHISRFTREPLTTSMITHALTRNLN